MFKIEDSVLYFLLCNREGCDSCISFEVLNDVRKYDHCMRLNIANNISQECLFDYNDIYVNNYSCN